MKMSFIDMRIKSHFDISGFALSLSRFETEALGNSEMAYLARMAIFNDNRTAMAHPHKTFLQLVVRYKIQFLVRGN